MATEKYTITKKQGGLRSGLMFYADGNTRDGMVDMISGSPGLIVGTGGSMVVEPSTRGWAFQQAVDSDARLVFNTPVLANLQSATELSLWWRGTCNDPYAHYILMGVAKAGEDGYLAVLDSGGDAELFLHLFQNGSFAVVGGSPIELLLDLQQQYLVTWKKDGETRFYREGQLFGVGGSNSLMLGTAGQYVTLGNLNAGSWGINGRTDGAAVWNRELRADEAMHLANDPLALRRACWRKKITNY